MTLTDLARPRSEEPELVAPAAREPSHVEAVNAAKNAALVETTASNEPVAALVEVARNRDA